MGFGRGKVILFGEHAVVHGYPAIAVGIERGVTASAEPASEDRLSIAPWNLALAPDPHGEPLERAFAVALEGYRERPALSIRADVELPAGAGLGCSAAIGVAVLDAIDEALGNMRDREALAEAALAWEAVFHGNPSGVDNTMSAVGGVALFRKGSPLESLHSNKPLYLVIGNSGESLSTKAMVDLVARQFADEHLDGFERLRDERAIVLKLPCNQVHHRLRAQALAAVSEDQVERLVGMKRL
ncbi:MAG: hypothetical protein AAF997_05520, partial [Myxococcota bacterium]